jgi:hypothetical protein
VRVVERVAGRVADHHGLGREAGNLVSQDAADAAEGLGGVDPVLAAGHPVDPVAVRREGHRVHVHLMSLAIDELEARGRLAGGEHVAAFAQRLLDLRAVLEPGHAVEVVVRSRLLPEQRVDRPAAVEPDRDAARLQMREQVEDTHGVHLRLRLSLASAPRHARAD